MGACKPLLALTAICLLAGCTTPVNEGSWLGPQENWRGIQNTWDDVWGWRDWMPGYQDRKVKTARKKACVRANTEGRVITQDGVSDHIAYQRCYDTPYDVVTGQRLDGR